MRRRCENLRRNRAVEGQHHQRLRAAAVPGDRHVGDVDLPPPQNVPEPADDAGPVLVHDEEHQRGELDLDLVAERAHEALVVAADDGAGYFVRLLALRSRHAHETREVARGAPALLAHFDATLGCHERRVHVVDGLLDAALESAVQRGDGEEARIVLGEPACGELEARRIAACELDE